MATKLERLSSVLEAQHQAWSELETVLSIRRQALRTGDIEGVTKDSRREHVIAETLRQLDAERVELATALGASTIDDVLDQLPESEQDNFNQLREGTGESSLLGENGRVPSLCWGSDKETSP